MRLLAPDRHWAEIAGYATLLGAAMYLRDDHPDHAITKEVCDALISAARGHDQLVAVVGHLLRDCIDQVIQTPKTGRRLYSELQNTEKTYIGTLVEIDLRSALGLKRGSDLDLEIGGRAVDVKFSGLGKSWMIPPEAIGQPCILITADENTSRFSMGVIVARIEYLTPGVNRDKKRSLSAAGRNNVCWICQDASYPTNFWLTVDPATAGRIADGRSGNERMVTLFREVQDRPISRKIVGDVARQLDFTRRVRADGARGTRNLLGREGIVVFSGTHERDLELIRVLGLPAINATEYLSHRLTQNERVAATAAGFAI